MYLLLKHVVIFCLFVTAFCCTYDGQCNRKVDCPGGQVLACRDRQCTCKVGNWCWFHNNCNRVCRSHQTPHCAWWQCFCHNTKKRKVKLL
ncbi:uncharacterized protein LOC134231825 isoform X1 [Saccostrea cucullata]|uniref:uncharacterized protein LOC134231825 isoform X1 n=1 Tax=Saccostrea cuccullata TaxID=36930 RepID=UPI002ED38215